MSGRPEATGGGYNEFNDDYNQDAWQEFTPWRPGDPSTFGEAPPNEATSPTEFDGWSRSSHPRSEPEQSPRRGNADNRGKAKRPGRWWTEEVPERYTAGDRVRSNAAIRGRLGMEQVPNNTKGQVTSTRHGVLGGEYATVRFENGYTEEIEINAIERRSWWD